MRKIDLTNFQVATSETARQINRRIALNFIRGHQPMSRADLARRLGPERLARAYAAVAEARQALAFARAVEAARSRRAAPPIQPEGRDA